MGRGGGRKGRAGWTREHDSGPPGNFRSLVSRCTPPLPWKTETDRHSGRQSDRQTVLQSVGQTVRQKGSEKDRDRHTVRQTDRQSGSPSDRL